MSNYPLQLVEKMNAFGMVPLTTTPIMRAAIGKFVRFRCDGDKAGTADGWAVFKGVNYGAFGHHRLGINEKFSFKDASYIASPKKQKGKGYEVAFGQVEARVEFEITAANEIKHNQDASEVAVQRILNIANDSFFSHPYVSEHKLFTIEDFLFMGILRLDHKYLPKTVGSALILPITNVSGHIVSLQRIFPDGSKRMLAGGAKKGNFIPTSRKVFDDKGVLAICEGWATGVAIGLMCKEWAVACAIDAGNLAHVAINLRNRFPNRQIVICSDWDGARERQPHEFTGNIGLIRARDAAIQVNAGLWVPNVTPGDETKSIDFWDVWARGSGRLNAKTA